MQGIIGAFLGLLVSFLLSLLLLNQPGVFNKVPEIINQPIYLFIIIVGTLLGLVLGYLSRTRISQKFEKKGSIKEEKPVSIFQFNESLSDTIVTVVALFSGIIVFLLDRWEYCLFISAILLVWFLYRSGILSRWSKK